MIYGGETDFLNVFRVFPNVHPLTTSNTFETSTQRFAFKTGVKWYLLVLKGNM